MSLDPFEMYEWRKAMEYYEDDAGELRIRGITPIFGTDEMTYNRRCRIDDLAPDRSLGIIAAYEYLAARVTHINTTIAIPALGIMIIALMLAVVAWAVR